MCPYYDALDEIFGTKSNIHVPHMQDTLELVEDTDNYEVNEISYEEGTELFNTEEVEANETYMLENNTSPITVAEDTEEERVSVDRVDALGGFRKQLSKPPSGKRKLQKSVLDSLTELQNSRTETQKLKLELEEKRIKIEETVKLESIELQKQQLELEKEKLAAKERMHRLNLEKEERVAKYEIELRYKFQQEVLNGKKN